MLTHQEIRPRAFDKFHADLEACNVRLPLSTGEDQCGVVFDATGRDVFTVDINRERPDIEAYKIASLIVLATNICGGFRKAATTGAPAVTPEETP